MLRPDIDDVMIALHDAGVFYTLSTKSILSKKRIKKLYDKAGLDRIQLSLDSFDNKIVHKLLGVSLDYVDKFVKMVKDMQEIGMDVRIKAVLTSYNADSIEDYLNTAAALGIKHIQVVGYGRSGYRHTDDIFPSDEQMQKASNAIQNFRIAHPEIELVGGGFGKSSESHKREDVNTLEEMMKKRVICNAGRFSLLMLPNGEVFICEHLPYSKEFVLGDLREDSLKDVWNGKGVRDWLSPPPRKIFSNSSACKTCPDDYYNYCHQIYSRCLRFCREYTGDVNTPDRNCPYSDFEEIRVT